MASELTCVPITADCFSFFPASKYVEIVRASVILSDRQATIMVFGVPIDELN
jgi:hypothetical protein